MPMKRNETAWSPPTAEALGEHLAAHPPRRTPPWVARLPLVVLGAALGVGLLVGGPAGYLLPWAALIGMVVYGSAQVRRAQGLSSRTERAHELALLRHYRPALRSAWRLVPDLAIQPLLQHRAVAIIAHCLDDLHAHEAALVAYDRLLRDLPDEHPGAVMLTIQRAVAELSTHRLADADESLRRLRSRVEAFPASPVDAAYRYALLYQSVQTAHYAEGIAESSGLVDALRPLGLEAGYGHALRAWCHAQRDEPGEAETWWARATSLLPPRVLVARFPLLEAIHRG